ncbi:hypothetical protein Sfulv_28080 [Streptomyces fulvorobeus]|uniref:Cytochrome P450 n=1 Tax=Streptomyces fulvorobeus TaxID=284028 RepID=A0A7J0C766_9ACTN|nr:hypothetical protein Sfulv_28080 [Streptomyces fulvorobeus]
MYVSFDPWSPAFVADPYPAYTALRAAGRAHFFEPTRQWLIPHHSDVSALLRDRRLGRTYLHRFTHEEFGRTPPPDAHEPFHTLNGQGLLDLEAPTTPASGGWSPRRSHRVRSSAWRPRWSGWRPTWSTRSSPPAGVTCWRRSPNRCRSP